jgi:hypothetical protein
MGEQAEVDSPAPAGGTTELLGALLRPPIAGPAHIQDLTSILLGPAQHFQLDLDQAPQTITAFRQVAQGLRDLMVDAGRLAEVRAPGQDVVSINAAKEIGQWAVSEEPGSLRWALESGAQELEKVADALERSVATHWNIDEASATHLSRSEAQ